MRKSKEKKLKHKGNLACRSSGWHDRILHLAKVNGDGTAVSSFIEERKTLFINEVSDAVDKAQMKVIKARIDADEIIAQLSKEDVALIAKGAANIDEKRRRRKVLGLFAALAEIRSDIKATYVNLHSTLNDSQTQIKRQLTAYLLTAFSRKVSVDIVVNTTVDYKDISAYQAYITMYDYVDRAVNEVVDTIISSETLCNCLKEVK